MLSLWLQDRTCLASGWRHHSFIFYIQSILYKGCGLTLDDSLWSYHMPHPGLQISLFLYIFTPIVKLPLNKNRLLIFTFLWTITFLTFSHSSGDLGKVYVNTFNISFLMRCCMSSQKYKKSKSLYWRFYGCSDYWSFILWDSCCGSCVPPLRGSLF